MELEKVSCNLCGADDFSVVYRGGYAAGAEIDFEPSTDRYGRFGTIVKCRACGHIYANPRPGPAFLADGYEQVRDDAYFAESESRSVNAYFSLSSIKRFKSGGKLLEIGSSTGFFLNAARLNFDVQGLELSKWGAEFTENMLKIPVIKTPLEAAKLPDASYDAVVLIDVIEHLPDPKGTVAEIARILKKGGLLYIVTPNIKGLSARLLGRLWWGLRPAHIHYFYPETIQKLLESAGFRVAKRKSFGKIFTYAYWLSRIKNYPICIYNTAERVISLFGVENKFLYIDPRDSMEISAILEK